MSKARLIRLFVTLAAGLAVALFAARWLGGAVPTPALPGGGGRAVTAAGIGGPFTLVDQNGRTVTEKSYPGEWRLMFFGYTFCPDICPTELQVIGQAMDRLGPLADKVRPLFITVDPQRDTPQQLADYVAQFHPRLVGLTGTPQQVGAAIKAWRVYAAKASGGDPQNYLMDHSTYVYLMSPDNKLVTVFDRGVTADAMAAAITKAIGAAGAGSAGAGSG